MSETIEKYGVLLEPSPHMLTNAVNLKIKEGWHPIGGVAQSPDGYCQAVVKYKLGLSAAEVLSLNSMQKTPERNTITPKSVDTCQTDGEAGTDSTTPPLPPGAIVSQKDYDEAKDGLGSGPLAVASERTIPSKNGASLKVTIGMAEKPE